MSDDDIRYIQAVLDDPELIEKLRRQGEEDYAKAPKCFCYNRCDGPHGNGEQCLECMARPTAKCMRIMVY